MTSIIKDQLTALHTNDMNKAYSYLAKGTTATISLDVFEKYIAQHPEMENYMRISIPEREIKNHEGYAKVTLESKDGKETTLEYAMVKEDGAWKISALRINESKSETQPSNVPPKLYEDKNDHYTVQYPENWSYKQAEKHSIHFNGKEGSSVIIQVIPDKSASRIYKNTNEAINDLKKQISANATDVKFLTTGEAELPTDPINVHGEYLIATYKYNGYVMKKMHFILFHNGAKTFYSWSYTSPIEQYENDLPIVKKMYESWKIRKQ